MRIANKPRRGIGDTTIARLQTYADAHGISLWEATEFPEEAGVGAAPLKAVQAVRTLLPALVGGVGAARAAECRAGVPHAAPVADGRRDGAHGARGRRARPRAHRLHGRARGR